MENPEPILPNTVVEPQPLATPVPQPGMVVMSAAEYDALKSQAASAQPSPMMQAAPFIDPEISKKNRTNREIIGLGIAALFVASFIIPGLSIFGVLLIPIGFITLAGFYFTPANNKQPSSPIMTVFKIVAAMGLVAVLAPICFFIFIFASLSASGSRGS
jgi:hypothetical protein